MFKYKKLVLVSCLISIIVFGLIIAVSVTASSKNGLSTTTEDGGNNKIDLSVVILDAGYGDYDDDSNEDDIFVLFEVSSNTPSVLKLHIYFDLILPSGFTYSALFYVVTDYTYLKLIIHAFNTATESGDYIAHLDVYRVGGGLSPGSTQALFVFDPPTQEGPGQPQYTISVVE